MKYLLCLLFVLSFNLFAITWGESQVQDPLLPDSTCKVNEPISSGSYIYHWPSKYDQVFWPLIDPNGIWHCEDSGFIAFIGDFEGLSESEVDTIREYLESSDIQINSQIDTLKHLEKVYSLRKTTEAFQNKFKRVLAYLYEEEGRLDLANEYRAKALAEINAALNQNQLTEYERLEYLYLSANYELQLGNPDQSQIQLKELKSTIENIKDEELVGFGDYLSQLIDDLPKMKSGGKLMPEFAGTNMRGDLAILSVSLTIGQDEL